jgi:hypothetical protein
MSKIKLGNPKILLPKLSVEQLKGVEDKITRENEAKNKLKERTPPSKDTTPSEREEKNDQKLNTKTPKVFLKKIKWPTNELPTPERTHQNEEKSKPETTSTRPITRSRTKRQPTVLGMTEPSIPAVEGLGGRDNSGRTKGAKTHQDNPDLEREEIWDRKMPDTITKAWRIAFIMALLSTVPPAVDSKPFELGLGNLPVKSNPLNQLGDPSLGGTVLSKAMMKAILHALVIVSGIFLSQISSLSRSGLS